MQYRTRRIPINRLLIDPNNYRFYDQPGWRSRVERRFQETAVQEATTRILENTSKYRLSELRQSFLANGYMPLERLVVTNYIYNMRYYIVIEGNRRVAALRTLLRDNRDGVLTLSEEQIEEFSRVPCMVVEIESDSPEERNQVKSISRTIMGIRHIAGPQEWGAFQQAYLVFQLREEEGQEFEEISEHLGMRILEVRRRYRAIKALRAMQNDELYGPLYKTDFYRLFHELVSLPDVREFFSWNHDEAQFDEVERARLFFEMIAPSESERPPKLSTYYDVRNLRHIIGNEAAERCLLDHDQVLAAALAIVQPISGAQERLEIVNEANRMYQVLHSAQIDALTQLSVEDIELLRNIIVLINSRVDEYRRLVEE